MTKAEFATEYGINIDEVTWCDVCKDWNYLDSNGYDTCECA